MANALYTKFKELQLSANAVDMINDDIKVTLVDTNDYSVNIATDQYYDDIAAGAKVAESGNLTTKSITNGVFDADNVTFSTVTGDESEALVIWKDTGTPATSPLIAYFDSVTGLPVTPNGGDISITWDSGANKIFEL